MTGPSSAARSEPRLRALPDPVWPVVALATIQFADAAMCVEPVPFVRRCLEGVRFPKQSWPLLAPLKVAAGAGLILGTRVPRLGLVANLGVVAYFVVAAAAHVRASYTGRDFWLNRLGMLGLATSSLTMSFVRR